MEGEPSKPILPKFTKKNKIETIIKPSNQEGSIFGSEFLGFETINDINIKNFPNKSLLESLTHTPISIQAHPESSSTKLPINPKLKELINEFPQQIAHQTDTAEEYQNIVLFDVTEDPTITDYSVAYKRLIQERNKPWKLNPSDIADFYLLGGYIGEHEGGVAHQEDPTYLAIAKAKGRVSDIGRRLLVALAHEQLDEYDRFATVNPSSVPEELRTTIHDHYQERGEQTGKKEDLTTSQGIEQEINAYLADFNAMIEGHASRGKTMDIFTHEDTNIMFGNALHILESQQRGRWQVMAKAMRALHDASIPMSEFVQSITATDGVGVTPEMEDSLERHREPFLIDRLLNYVHNTGTMSARVTNYFPRAASLLLAHGFPGHNDYLLYHSSVGYGSDTLGKGIQQYARRVEGSDLMGDLTTAVQIQQMPREYMPCC